MAHRLTTKVTRRTLLGGAATGVASLAVGGALRGSAAAVMAQATPAARKSGGNLVFAESDEPPTLDIHKTAFSTAEVLAGSILDRLVYLNPETGKFDPALATSWETTPDGLNWTFKLRTDVVFQDGTPFNAQAVKRNFDRIMDPKTASGRSAALLGGALLKSIEAPDDTTIKLSYSQPLGPLLSGLNTSFCGIFSPAALDKYGDDIGQNPVGSGPFQFKSWEKGKGITLTPFAKYNWAPTAWGASGPPVVDSFVWRGITEATTRMVALQRDEAQIVRVPFANFKDAKNGDFQVLQLNNPGMPQAIYQNTTKPPLDDKNVRLAVAHAIDRDAVIGSPFLGGAVWAEYAPLTKGVLGYDPDLAKRVGVLFDLDKSKALLDEAGWKAGGDGMRSKDGQPLTLKLITTSGGGDTAQVTQLLLQAAGIKTEITQLDSAAWKKAVSGGEHHLTWRADTGTDPDILYLAVHSSAIGATNYVRAKNDELDGLLDKGRTTVDADARVPIYQKAQEIILGEGYIIPVYNSVRVFAMQPYVKGVQFNALAGVIPYGGWLDK
ncbi:MAG TPA: ABC transporter substrate-binding protein [Thermomicrobiales bacterium]|nr:ABC transporter substrate-binding protein [Thermomicrobiales bacterium]